MRDSPLYCTSTNHIRLTVGYYSSIALTTNLYDVALSGSQAGLKLCRHGSRPVFELNAGGRRNNHAVWSQHFSGSQGALIVDLHPVWVLKQVDFRLHQPKLPGQHNFSYRATCVGRTMTRVVHGWHSSLGDNQQCGVGGTCAESENKHPLSASLSNCYAKRSSGKLTYKCHIMFMQCQMDMFINKTKKKIFWYSVSVEQQSVRLWGPASYVPASLVLRSVVTRQLMDSSPRGLVTRGLDKSPTRQLTDY